MHRFLLCFLLLVLLLLNGTTDPANAYTHPQQSENKDLCTLMPPDPDVRANNNLREYNDPTIYCEGQYGPVTDGVVSTAVFIFVLPSSFDSRTVFQMIEDEKNDPDYTNEGAIGLGDEGYQLVTPYGDTSQHEYIFYRGIYYVNVVSWAQWGGSPERAFELALQIDESLKEWVPLTPDDREMALTLVQENPIFQVENELGELANTLISVNAGEVDELQNVGEELKNLVEILVRLENLEISDERRKEIKEEVDEKYNNLVKVPGVSNVRLPQIKNLIDSSIGLSELTLDEKPLFPALRGSLPIIYSLSVKAAIVDPDGKAFLALNRFIGHLLGHDLSKLRESVE